MKQSQLFTKTQKSITEDDIAKNYEYLVKGGFVNQEMAGVYSFLPMGHMVIEKITQVIREEMNAVGGQEVDLSALHPKENWKKTGRWDDLDILFQVKSRHGNEYALGPTHEEIVVPMAKKFISSYKDVPLTDGEKNLWPKAVYQMQTKFRDEKRAKSGVLRGREFLMKDLYSFHQSGEDLEAYYAYVLRAYQKIFKRLELNAIVTEASGGSFSKVSHEFQVPTDAGEDIIYYCKGCDVARNREIVGDSAPSACDKCEGKVEEIKTAEVGNIFKLNTKYSDPFEFTYRDEDDTDHPVYMGCYGIGITRIMGVIVETHNDDNGIIWPHTLAPFTAHIIAIGEDSVDDAIEVYELLEEAHIPVLYDDRVDASTGEKFADADLIGCPYRLVMSKKTDGKVEVKKRNEDTSELIEKKNLLNILDT